MTALNCTQLADVAPELALGVLGGRERAEALEHLDGCGSCRHLVSSLSGVTDELLRSFAPSVQPSAGFETRVLAAMTPSPRVEPRRIPRRRTMAVLAAAACVIAVLAGVLTIGRSSTPAFAAAEMRTPAGEIVGWIHVDRHQPVTVQMSLPGWANQIQRYGRASDAYSLRITLRTGVDRVLPVSLDGEAAWTVTLDIDVGAITSASLIDATGHVWCQAAFD